MKGIVDNKYYLLSYSSKYIKMCKTVSSTTPLSTIHFPRWNPLLPMVVMAKRKRSKNYGCTRRVRRWTIKRVINTPIFNVLMQKIKEKFWNCSEKTKTILLVRYEPKFWSKSHFKTFSQQCLHWLSNELSLLQVNIRIGERVNHTDNWFLYLKKEKL